MTTFNFRLRLIALCMAISAPAAAAEYPHEFWVNPDQGWVVETKACDSGLCGFLVGYRNADPHPPGYVPKDIKNPDPNHRGQPLCGLMLMGGPTMLRATGRMAGFTTPIAERPIPARFR